MKYAKRVDDSHRAVSEAFRVSGWLVLDTHALANFVDLVVYGCRRGNVDRHWSAERRVFLIEVKRPDKVARPSAYTSAQKKLAQDGWPVVTLCSETDVINFIENRP